MSTSIEIDDKAFLGALEVAMAGIKGQAIRKIDDTAKSIEKKAVTYAPERTGALKASIHADEHGSHLATRNGYETKVGTTLSYASWVEYGTKPHDIKVKNAKVLTDGETFFGRYVVHPGTVANPFMRTAIAEAAAEFDR